ncbi:Uncharacterized protein dnm_070690 [Desulfonema magnum]|uniref:Uncharacterized protein n=1 Tax=Desulfonema magnum TaxID=45655 RepID=A0A975GRK2_9BACT|nr:Uncharacterized protein dnm_070690 [Desulfonema magnum]
MFLCSLQMEDSLISSIPGFAWGCLRQNQDAKRPHCIPTRSVGTRALFVSAVLFSSSLTFVRIPKRRFGF